MEALAEERRGRRWGIFFKLLGFGYLAVALGVGVVGLALSITVGPYPVSMVGLPGDEISNMSPPTVALLSQGLALCGAAALARGPMARVLARLRPWRAVVTAGAFAMTAFLWHLTALLFTLLSAGALGISAIRLGAPVIQPGAGAAPSYLVQPFSVEFLREYWLHFELTSVLLVAAVVAAIAIIRSGRRSDG